MPWTSKNTETLKALWAEGLSASEIAKHIGGLTRNAVIGKVHRLGLGGRRKAPKAPRRARTRATASRAPKKPRAVNGRKIGVAGLLRLVISDISQRPTDLPPLGEAPATPVNILTLRRGLCHWPEGDPKDALFHFCGRAASGVYCEHHELRAYLRESAED